ncbi:hypothetical protein PROFUN_15996 [Planoprotostelium fungivorum]|uniref:Uncharacterized protein n=1 Tax=Planoprotostelium fungivorum TaxID=1890364 RepID=A0A2P6MTD2_9EUKA|nr:hypothetical protein PROFUN_15996 [Planoprotostelium fungivorum]
MTLPTLLGRKSLFHKHLQEIIIRASCHALLLFPDKRGLGSRLNQHTRLSNLIVENFVLEFTISQKDILTSSVRNVEEDPSSITLGFESVSSTVHSPWATLQAIYKVINNIGLNQKLDAYLNPSLNTATSNTLKTQPFLVMAGVDPYATFRISLQAKVSNNLPFGFQDPAFAPLNSKIFAPKNVSQLAIWDSQANPTAAITAWVTPGLYITELTVFEDLGQSIHLDMLWAASSFSSLLSQLFLPVSTMYYKARIGSILV